MVALTSFFAAAVGNVTTILPTDPALRYIGRTATVATERGYDAVMYDMPGVEVRFRVRGTASVSALVQQHWADGPTDTPSGCVNAYNHSRPNNFLVFLNGIRRTDHERLNSGSRCIYCTFDTGVYRNSSEPELYRLVTDLDLDREHEIRLFKDSEADFDSCEPWPNWVMLHGILIEAGGEVFAPEPPRNAEARTKIEFIGGSSLAGRCNLCGRPWDAPVNTGEELLWASSIHKSWVGQLCGPHGWDADCHITAWSGMGIASGLDARANVFLPQVFRRTVQSLPDEGNQWNFSSWTPDVVILDVGLEDEHISDKKFHDAYVQLVLDLVDWYGPEVRILTGCGTTTTSYCRRVRDIVSYCEHVYIYLLPLDRDGRNDNTCCQFPDLQTHADISELVELHIERAIEDVDGPNRSARGPLAALIALICVGVTAAAFLLWHCLRGGSKARTYTTNTDFGDTSIDSAVELPRR